MKNTRQYSSSYFGIWACAKTQPSKDLQNCCLQERESLQTRKKKKRQGQIQNLYSNKAQTQKVAFYKAMYVVNFPLPCSQQIAGLGGGGG